jgi:serine/threonine protein phosphatase PrpC
MHSHGTATPYVSETTLDLCGDCPLLILACDGVWDVFSDQEAADLLMERFSCEGPFTDAAKYLVSTVTDSSLTGLLAKCPPTAY